MHAMKKLTTRLAIAALVGATTLVAADQGAADRISLLLGSQHIGASGQFEEFNPGIFYTWDKPAVDISLGAYRNSYGRTSLAAVGSIPLASWRDGELAAFAGVAHYPQDGRNQVTHLGADLVPVAGLQVRQGPVFVQFTPMDGKPVDALVAFGVTFEME